VAAIWWNWRGVLAHAAAMELISAAWVLISAVFIVVSSFVSGVIPFDTKYYIIVLNLRKPLRVQF
jgi:hypothetical protein